jgi:DNA (cytosine-5)-methyltransferase 1
MARARKFAVAEFFAGIGLMRLALEAAGMRVLFANDLDPDKRELYAQNFDARHFSLEDVHKLEPASVPQCDLFTASFPCNDLSVAGGRAGLSGGQSSAFWGFMEVVKGQGENRPAAILLENVPGFLLSNEGRDFRSAIEALNGLGYACDALILDAADFVPQSRQRLFVVAKQGVEGKFPFGLAPSRVRPASLVDFMLQNSDLNWDVVKLAPPEPTGARLESILEELPSNDPAWWDEERATYFMGQLSPKHATLAREMVAGKKATYATAFRRVRKGRSMAELRTDGIAGCLRTPRGGSGRQILFKAGRGKYQVRLLTPRECARLQGVPDDYRIDVPLNQALFGFGDAVCVPAVEWLARNYLLPFLAGDEPGKKPPKESVKKAGKQRAAAGAWPCLRPSRQPSASPSCGG